MTEPSLSLAEERSVLSELLNRQKRRIADLERELAEYTARLDVLLAAKTHNTN